MACWITCDTCPLSSSPVLARLPTAPVRLPAALNRLSTTLATRHRYLEPSWPVRYSYAVRPHHNAREKYGNHLKLL